MYNIAYTGKELKNVIKCKEKLGLNFMTYYYVLQCIHMNGNTCQYLLNLLVFKIL